MYSFYHTVVTKRLMACILISNSIMFQLQNQKNLSEIVELLVQYIPFVTITVLNAVLPIIFQKLVQFEDYRYEFGFKLTLARYACWFHFMMSFWLTYGKFMQFLCVYRVFWFIIRIYSVLAWIRYSTTNAQPYSKLIY